MQTVVLYAVLILFHIFYVCECIELIICEGSTKQVTCPNGGLVKVEVVKYGRTEAAVPSCDWSTSITCFNLVDPLATGCHMVTSCYLTPSNNGIFGSDPCPNTRKYLNVTYDCIAEATTHVDETTTKATTVIDETTTTLTPVNPTSLTCQCPCTAVGSNQWDYLYDLNLTKTEMQTVMYSFLESLKQNISIDKRDTNKFLRSKTSAADNRQSAQSIGGAGAAIIVTVALLLVVPDVCNVFLYFAKRRI